MFIVLIYIYLLNEILLENKLSYRPILYLLNALYYRS